MVGLFGQRDELLRLVEAAFPVQILVRGNEITITGSEVEADRAGRLFEEMVVLLEQGHVLDSENVGRSIEMLKADQRPTDVLTTEVVRGRKSIRPKTSGQKVYVDAVRDHTVTFAIGPAGTGKSYLAVALAVQALQAKEVNRIILTRPAVEAGERLGFLPGDILQKVDPYLRPLYDALYDMLEPEVVVRLMERGTIEVAPLAYMRGRTLNDSFIILDEAQNTTPEQMKMFLTRLGFGSKAVITGDVTQIDLPDGRGRSGLLQVRDVLEGIEGLLFVELGSRDVVRHRIVQDIVDAYERHDQLMDTETGPTVFGADEQRDIDIEVSRWVGLARLVLTDERVNERYGDDVEMSLMFVDEQTIAELNVRFLGGDGPTDVLAFPMDEELPPGGRQPDQGGRGPGAPTDAGDPPALLGDVVVCPAIASRQAAEHGVPPDDELALLVVHGVLHLLDYDHAEPEETAAMRRREQELLARFRDLEREG